MLEDLPLASLMERAPRMEVPSSLMAPLTRWSGGRVSAKLGTREALVATEWRSSSSLRRRSSSSLA